MNIETERKFLIEYPKNLPDDIVKIDIEQIYLIRNDPLIQRRVRKIVRNGITKCVYTEKKHITEISREENEFEISSEKYDELLKEKDTSLAPVIKTRILLTYKNQNFEIDTYPFSDKYASIELELESEDQKILFPDYINIIKEVTSIPGYSNIELALNQKFPEE